MAAVLILLIVLVLMPLSWFYIRGMFRETKSFNLIGLPSNSPHFAPTLASISDSHYTHGNAVHFYSDIDVIQKERLRAIAQAKHSIVFETYKISSGRRAKDFSAALQERARQGVTVQLLADSYGAKDLPDSYWTELKNAGVEVRFFNPFSWRSPIDYLRRNHRKLLIIDQTIALIGGAGISDYWDGEKPASTDEPWFDFEVHWRGKVVGFLTGLFWQHWLDSGGTVDLRNHQPEEVELDNQNSVVNNSILVTAGEDPTPQNSPIRSLFQASALSAQERIWIASPYLLPDRETCEILAIARQKGVDVRILTMGHYTDKAYVYYTSRSRYGPLLKHQIKLHEYQPSMLHAKVILVDNNWVSMGSANLDPRSFFHNDELNLCTNNTALIQAVEIFFQQGFNQSQLIRLDDWKRRPWYQKLVGSVCNIGYWQF